MANERQLGKLGRMVMTGARGMVAYASLIRGDKDETTVWINGYGSTIDRETCSFFFIFSQFLQGL
jgi:hypothetical protein